MEDELVTTIGKAGLDDRVASIVLSRRIRCGNV